MNLYKSMAGIAALAVLLLLGGYPFRNDDHGIRWLPGGIGWFGFLACVVGLIVLALVVLGRSVFRKTTTA
jgi:hypothetical protein